jgi:hypothetical protein
MAMRDPGDAPLLPHDEREVVLRADFDALDADDCCWVSLHFLTGPRRPRAGDWVYLLDGRGGGCLGRIDAVHGWIARARPDWGSWRGDTRPRPARQGPRHARDDSRRLRGA